MEQAAGRRVGRRGGFDHMLEQGPELEQSELIGEREGAALGAQQCREHQALAVQIVMLAGAVERLGRHHPRLDPERLLQPPPQRLGDGERVAERPGQRLRRLLQIGEMIAARLDMVAHPILRRDRSGFLILPVGRPPPQLDQRRIEPRHRIGRRRRLVGQLDQFVARHGEAAEHRVGENLGELGRADAVAALRREALQIDIIGLGQPQQHARRHRPLIALDMVEIGRRDADLGRHRALVQPQLAAQPPHFRAQEQLALGHFVMLS